MGSYNPFSIEGKQILVTGAGSGIGRAVSVEASKLGAKVILLDINKEAQMRPLLFLREQVIRYVK